VRVFTSLTQLFRADDSRFEAEIARERSSEQSRVVRVS
jgi:hypothetical protein